MNHLDFGLAILAAVNVLIVLLDYRQACAERDPKARGAVRDLLVPAYPVVEQPFEFPEDCFEAFEDKQYKVVGKGSYKRPGGQREQ